MDTYYKSSYSDGESVNSGAIYFNYGYPSEACYGFGQATATCSDSGRFFQIVLSISECLPENSSLNYELDGFCPVQIGCVEAEIRNLKEDLHTKIFLILYNRKSGTLQFTI